MIKFEHVFLKYVNDFFTLYDFSCEITSHTLFVGDFFSGTTAIMRTISKIDKDYTGEIFIDDENIKNIKDKDLSVAYLPQKPVLFKNKNIFKNLYFPLKIRKIDKNSAKNLINSVFFELKNNNFEIFNNYLDLKNKKENLNNNDLIDKILNLKVKNLNLSEKKILTLIRAVLRKPKYILLENFFEDLDESYFTIVTYLLNKLKDCSTIIACEKQAVTVFKDFHIINLDEEKKEV